VGNKKKFWTFRSQEKDPKKAELLLYGVIENYSWWGDEVTPKQFKNDLDELGDIDELNVYINSEGGDVFAAQAIYSMIKRHEATVNVYIDGLAASAASVIAMAGDNVYMPANAMMMIHNPWTVALGNSDEFRKIADDLDKIRESIVATYEAKTGLETKKIEKFMDKETWFTAEEAFEYGFADEIEQEKKVAASLKGGILTLNGQVINLSRYKNPPKMIVLKEEIDQGKSEKQQGNKQNQAEEDLFFLYQKQIELQKKKYSYEEVHTK